MTRKLSTEEQNDLHYALRNNEPGTAAYENAAATLYHAISETLEQCASKYSFNEALADAAESIIPTLAYDILSTWDAEQSGIYTYTNRVWSKSHNSRVNREAFDGHAGVADDVARAHAAIAKGVPETVVYNDLVSSGYAPSAAAHIISSGGKAAHLDAFGINEEGDDFEPNATSVFGTESLYSPLHGDAVTYIMRRLTEAGLTPEHLAIARAQFGLGGDLPMTDLIFGTSTRGTDAHVEAREETGENEDEFIRRAGAERASVAEEVFGNTGKRTTGKVAQYARENIAVLAADSTLRDLLIHTTRNADMG